MKTKKLSPFKAESLKSLPKFTNKKYPKTKSLNFHHSCNNKWNDMRIKESIFIDSIVIIFKSQVTELIDPMDLRQEISSLVKTFNLWVITKGPLETISRIKMLRIILARYLSSNPLLVVDKCNISIDIDGLPNVFSTFFKTNLQSRDNLILYRLMFTILKANTMIKYWGIPDLSTISNKSIVDDVVLPSINTVEEFFKFNKIKKINTIWRKPHLSTKSGPMGISLQSAIAEAKIIPNEMREHLQTISGERLLDWIDDVKLIPEGLNIKSEYDKSNNPKERIWKTTLRKLSIIKSPEAKLRPIAIFDYWTQTSLKPLHDHIMIMLRNFNSDCTHDQDSFAINLIPKGPYWCYDMTACTDRLPVSLQKMIVNEITNNKRGDSWEYLMTALPFHVPFDNKQHKDEISYEVGQPMGAYSSWAVMALTHHFIVFWASKRAKLRNFRSYLLLGDDIVIMNKKVSIEYKNILRELGVEISAQKTIISKDTMEFAKRLFHKGKEYSHYPIEALIEQSHKYTYFSALLFPLIKRGYLDSIGNKGTGFCFPWKGWFKIHSNKPSNQLRRLEDKVALFVTVYYFLSQFKENLPSWSESRLTEVALWILNKMDYDVGCNRSGTAKLYLLEVMATIKANMLQDRIVANAQQINGWYQEIRAKQINVNEELEQESPLPEGYDLEQIPHIVVGRQNIVDLQGYLEVLRVQIREQAWHEVLISGKEAQLVDPTGLSTRRSYLIIIASNGVVVNQARIMLRHLTEDINRLLSMSDKQWYDDTVPESIGS
jgi:hypothetical protein